MKKGIRQITATFTAALLLLAAGCGKSESTTSAPDSVNSGSATLGKSEEFGTGGTAYTLEVTHKNGEVARLVIHTDETVLGDSLENEGIVKGEESAYGLYVKTVDGETLDYDTDGAYWALYINGQYAAAGIDSTEITDGALYEFRAQTE